MNDYEWLNQLMRLGVYIRPSSFFHICGSPYQYYFSNTWSAVYIRHGKFNLHRIYEQNTFWSKICYRKRVYLFHGVYKRPTAYGRNSANLCTHWLVKRKWSIFYNLLLNVIDSKWCLALVRTCALTLYWNIEELRVHNLKTIPFEKIGILYSNPNHS